jgi:HK97 family phage major capsid protein
MSSMLEELRASRQDRWQRANDIAQAATVGGRYFTDQEQRDFDALSVEIDQFDERIKEVAGQQQRSLNATDVFSRLSGGEVRRRPSNADQDLMDEFRSAGLERNPKPIDVVWDKPRSHYQPGLERRDLVTTAPANMMPVSFYGQIVEHMVESSAVLRAGATLITTASGEDLRVPRSTALSTAAIVTEGSAIGESDPTLSSVTMRAYKYGILIQVSNEMLTDAGVDLQGYLARETGQAIGLALGAHLISGTGTGQPRGVLADTTAGATGPTGTATTFGAQGTAGQGTDLLYDLYGSLAEPYVAQAATGWLLRNATLTNIRKLKTGTAGEIVGGEFVGPGPAGSSGEMIGKPAFVDPNVPAMAANAKSVLFGDWSRYFVRMVNGLKFEASPDFAFDRDVTTFRALLRADGALVDTTGSIKHFAHSAS